MPYQRTTLATLKQRLQERVGNNVVFWDETELQDALNEAIEFWQALTGEWTRDMPLTVNGTNFQDVPAQFASVFRVRYVSDTNNPGPGTPLNLTSLQELDYGFPGWRGTAGTALYWAPAGLNKLVVYPAPTAGYLFLEGYREAPTLQADADFLDLGDEEIVRLLGYAQWYLAFKEGAKEATENVDPLLQQMIAAAAQRNARLNQVSSYRAWLGEHRDEDRRAPRGAVRAPGVRTAATGSNER